MTATFSVCGRYRYTLERDLGGERHCTFIMLNPSTADALNDDPTIRRCIGFARSWGMGRLVVVNLFAYRATKPANMRREGYPVGEHNSEAILSATKVSRETGGLIVAAWGTHGGFRDRDREVMAELSIVGDTVVCLGVTAAGFPRHPLYVRADQKPIPYMGRT